MLLRRGVGAPSELVNAPNGGSMTSESIERFSADSLLFAVLGHVTEPVIFTDLDGTVLAVNRAFETFTEVPVNDLCGHSLQSIDILDVDTGQADALYRDVQSEKEWTGSLFLKGRVSREENETTVGVPLRDATGTVVGCGIICSSGNFDKHPDEQQLQSQKLEVIGQMAAGIAHEINTPTQYIGDNVLFLKEATTQLSELITLYCQLLESKERSEDTKDLMAGISELSKQMDLEFVMEELPGAIERTIEGNKRVAEVVRAMKEFAHPGTERVVPTDLNHLIEGAIAITRSEWKYVAELVSELDSDLPLVPCLPGSMNQVILNLIINAAHALGEKQSLDSSYHGRITISTSQVGDWAELRVEDTGAGIPEEIRDRIFDPFFTTKGVGKGTGQGLAIVQSIVKEVHNGSLECISKVGEGTTFVMKFPLKQKNGRPSSGAISS